MNKNKPYRIYNCDPMDQDHHKHNNHNGKGNGGGDKGNGNGNGTDVVKIQGVINEYGDLTSTGGNGGTALATAANNFAILANSTATSTGGFGGAGGLIAPINPVTNVPVSFLDGSFNGNLNGLLNDNLNDNFSKNFNDSFSENFRANDNDGIDVG